MSLSEIVALSQADLLSSDLSVSQDGTGRSGCESLPGLRWCGCLSVYFRRHRGALTSQEPRMLSPTAPGSNPGTPGLALSVLLTLPSWRHGFSAFSPHYSTWGGWGTQGAKGK